MSEDDQIEAEERLLEHVRAGHGVLLHANIDLGVSVVEQPDGRITLSVMKDVIRPGYDGPALRAFMQEIIAAWSEQLARPEKSANELQAEYAAEIVSAAIRGSDGLH